MLKESGTGMSSGGVDSRMSPGFSFRKKFESKAKAHRYKFTYKVTSIEV